jgi:uncharacterized protein (TIGR00730 family)
LKGSNDEAIPEKKRSSSEPWEAELEKLVQSAVGPDQKPARHAVVMDIFRTALKLAKESHGTLNLKITSTTLRELRFSFKTFWPHRASPKITIFGSARVPAKTPLYEFTKDFAAKAVKRKYLVITGGGPGIMAAGNEGAETAGFGLNIRLPFEQEPNPFIDQESMLVNYKYFFTRKLFLVKEAAAFAFCPGGFGTFDEAFEVLTLLQTGKTNPIPVVLLEPPKFGYWKSFMEFVNSGLLKNGFINETDLSLFKVFTSADEALDHIQHFYRVYHSMRFVKGHLVIRMKKQLSEKVLAELNEKFGDMTEGTMIQRGPMDEEANEPEFKELTRLVFTFDKQDYGKLRRLIDYINDKAI